MNEQAYNVFRFKSRYSPDKLINELQYLVEIVCENRAIKHKVDLPIKFWELEEWEKYYKSQLKIGSILIKRYGIEKVLDFVKTKRIFNMFPKWVEKELCNWTINQKNIVTKKAKGLSGLN